MSYCFCSVWSACGGGSGTRRGPRAGTPPKPLDLDKLSTAGITTLRDAVPVFAQDETDTLGEVLANPANVVPALAATLYRHRAAGQEGVELATDLFVKSIRRNASGAYVIGYVLDGADEQVTIPLDSCPDGCRVTVNGREFAFWASTGDDDDMATVEDGLGEFEYLAVHRVYFTPDDTQRRTSFVFGVRNEDVPMGTATYHARFRTRTWETANDDRDQRQRIYGTMRIVANFDMGALEGRVYRIQGSPRRGISEDRANWPTSSFTLTDGRIVNGQFTATLTGVDSDPNTPLDESVRDFMGQVLGEFYGPNAEEVGGVVTATRDLAGTADDRVLYGYIGGRKIDRLTGVNDSAFVTGVYRDSDTNSTIPTDVERTTTVESTSNGFRITYVVDGQTQTVELGEGDFGANPSRSTSYSKTTNGTEFRLWSNTGSFTGTGIFEHLDINAWGIYPHLDSIRFSDTGFIVYGARTTDMPTTGTADYAGRILGTEWPGDAAVGTSSSQVTWYRGELGLTADFGGSTVTGNVTNLRSRPGGTSFSDYATAPGGLNFNATISGNELSATDLSGSGSLAHYSNGSVEGAFYGPGAVEVGGIFEAEDAANNKLLSGTFAAEKQQ